jgi:hypothetical protein
VNKSKLNDVVGACSTHGGGEKCMQKFSHKHEWKPRCMEYNIKMYSKEIECGLNLTGS